MKGTQPTALERELTLRRVDFDPLGFQVWNTEKTHQFAGIANGADLDLFLSARAAALATASEKAP